MTLPIPEDVTGISGEVTIGLIDGREVKMGGDGLVAGRVERAPATSVLLSDWRSAGHARPCAWPRP